MDVKVSRFWELAIHVVNWGAGVAFAVSMVVYEVLRPSSF